MDRKALCAFYCGKAVILCLAEVVQLFQSKLFEVDPLLEEDGDGKGKGFFYSFLKDSQSKFAFVVLRFHPRQCSLACAGGITRAFRQKTQ